MLQNAKPGGALQSDLHPPLSRHEAAVEADRCYFCHDAPCTIACPTDIDVPLFIRQIQAGNPLGAATTILDENILGGMCARVCPTETLCEQACVRQTAEDQPLKIGALQRFATDSLQRGAEHPYQRAADTGKRIAVVGAGPAGLSCAHRLAMYGHAVTIFDANPKPGGLNEYGIAAYKAVDDFAQKEVEFILGIGGIELKQGVRLGSDIQLDALCSDYDCVFLGIGLGDVNNPAITGDGINGVHDAVDFIAELRQSSDYSKLDAGNQVVVIGGGMTAIDAAVQSKMLGAAEVTVAYRRGAQQMNASRYEQELAQTQGVLIRHFLQPLEFTDDGNGQLTGVVFEQTTLDDSNKLVPTGKKISIAADRVLKAVGQTLNATPLGSTSLELKHNRIVVDRERRTSQSTIFAGGDCIVDGEDLTVTAVQDGKLAAEAMHRQLC
ncbi:MAG: NAD(P)-dependent oxidoreductase [Pseudomonadota bacterium]